jgi:hypothetical protein
MRIRSIKPEFWRSLDIAAIRDWGTRLLFVGLWSYVDDNGVGVDRFALIAADLFADDLEREPSETFARVSRGLQELSELGRIVRYTVDGKQYLSIVNWAKHQRIDSPNKPRYPLPDGRVAFEDAPTRVNTKQRKTPAKPSRESSETPATGAEEQGNRGTECGAHADPPPSPFCDVHPNGTRKRCGDCGNARTAFREWERSQDEIEQQRVDASEADRRRRRAAIDSCTRCDDFGRLDDLSPCPEHEPLRLDPLQEAAHA